MGCRRFMLQRSLFDQMKEKIKPENSPLAGAAIQDNLRELKNLAEQGHDLRTKFQEGNTLLHIAVAYGSLSVVGHLLDVKAIDLESRNFLGWTALFIAAVFTRDLSLVRRLLDVGAKAMTTSSDGITSLDYILNWAPNLTEEHAAITRLLMEITDGQFSLHVAVLKDPILAFTLIEMGADVNEHRLGGNTPLHVAVAHAKVECVQLLLEANANANQSNKYGFTPIHLCLENNGSLLRRVLQNRAALDLHDLEHETLVHHAVYRGKADILARLLKVGASVNSRNLEGDTPLHLAIQNYLPNCTELVQVLINAGADVDATNCFDETPLVLACSYPEDNFDIVAMLLYHDADPSIANDSGTTPFMASLVRNALFDRQELLFLYETDFDRVDYSGNSVLGLALLCDSPLLPELIAMGAELALSSDEMLNLLSKPGMFRKLWHMINHETFSWCGFDSVLSYAVYNNDTNIFGWVIVSEDLPRVLDLMYNLRTQNLRREHLYTQSRFGYGSGFSRLQDSRRLLTFALRTFDKETASKYVYILLSHGYQPDYREAEFVFGFLGQCRLFSLCSEIDLQPSKMSKIYLLPNVMFDVSQSLASHINQFVWPQNSDFRLSLNVASIIASFFPGRLAMKLHTEVLGHSLPSLRELCRDCIRDTVCATQKVQTYGDYRRMIRAMTYGNYIDILLFEQPLYSVDKECVSSLRIRLDALIGQANVI